jgi:hypothetical protein
MGSIVGAGVKVSRAKRKRPKSKATGKYLERNKLLPYVGYVDYREYLKSSDWKAIRMLKLAESSTCQCCNSSKKISVHHYCYDASVLLGLFPGLLVVLCNKCHEAIEFIDGQRKEKTTLADAQKRLHDILAVCGKEELSSAISVTYAKMKAMEREANDRRVKAKIESKKEYEIALDKWKANRKKEFPS